METGRAAAGPDGGTHLPCRRQRAGDRIQAGAQGTVEAITQIARIVEQIAELQTANAGAVEEQTVTTNEISRNLGEAARGAGEIAQNITGVATAAKETTEGATQTQGASTDLARMAADLQTLVSRFRYETSETVASRPAERARGEAGSAP